MREGNSQRIAWLKNLKPGDDVGVQGNTYNDTSIYKVKKITSTGRDKAEVRIQELEDALVEYQRLGKTVSEAVVPCLTAHGNCDQCRPKAKAACDAIETIRKGKIGPDAALKKQWDDVMGTKPRSWQITDERRKAIALLIVASNPEKIGNFDFEEEEAARAVLRAMWEEGQ
jgi:hypothetical protein